MALENLCEVYTLPMAKVILVSIATPEKGLVRRNRGWIQARAACQVSDRARFEDPECAKAVGFSHGDLGLVVQTLHDAAGKELLGAEIVEDQLAVLTKRPGDLFHRFDARTHRLPSPLIEELPGPGRRG